MRNFYFTLRQIDHSKLIGKFISHHLFLGLLILLPNISWGQTTFTGTGNWNTPGNWSAGVPTAGVDAIINGTCTITAAATCNNLTINATTGSLSINNNQNLTVNGTTSISGSFTDGFNGGTNIFTGLVTINSGGTWTSTSVTTAGNLTFRGGITNSGTFSAGAATFNTNTQTITANTAMTFGGAIAFNANTTLAGASTLGFSGAVTIANNITVTNDNTNTVTGVTIVGLLNGSANSIFLNRGLLTYQNATQPMGTGTLNATTNPNTVNYNLAGAQGVKATTYHHLQITGGSNTKTLQTSSATVNGDFTISSGTSFNPAGLDFTVSGNSTIAGTFADGTTAGTTNMQNVDLSGGTINGGNNGVVNILGNLSMPSGNGSIGQVALTVTGTTTVNDNRTLTISSSSGSKIFNGTVTINSGAIWNNSGNEDITFGNGLTHNGTTFSSGTGNYTFNTTAGQTLSGTSQITFNGRVDIDVNTTINNSHASGVTFNLSNGTATATSLDIGSSTIVTNQTIVNIANNLTSLGGSNDTWLNDVNSTLNYGGANRPMGTGANFDVDQAGNTVNYNNSNAAITQDIKADGVSNDTYFNLRVSNSAAKNWLAYTTGTINFNILGNLEISGGTLTLNRGTTSTANLILTVNGNLQINGGILDLSVSTTTGFSTINLKGNLVHTSGTIQVTGTTTGSNAIIFNGTSAQTITGGGTTTGGVFEINNSNGVSLTNNANVFTLRLTNGVVTTGSNILTVNNSATTGIIAGNTFSGTNSVNGNLARVVTASGTYNFPISASGTYSSLDVVNPSTATTITAQVFNTNPTGGAAGAGMNTLLNNNLYWRVNSAATISTAIRLNVSGLGSTSTIGRRISSATGFYTNIGGTVTTSDIASGNFSMNAATDNFFVIGTGGTLSGTYSVGTGCQYTNLTEVATTLNNSINVVTGNVIFEFCSGYDGTSGETFPISFSPFTTSGGSHTVTVRPATGVTGRVTSGTSASNGLIVFNGVDRLTFDGRPGGVGTTLEWTISCTSTAIGTFTFLNDASNNTVQYCTIESASTSTTNGAVFFSTGTTTGNDDNTIQFCTLKNSLTPSGGTGTTTTTNLPMRAIRINGTSSAIQNNNIQILNNNIYNFFSNANNTINIDISANTNNVYFQNNSFYQTVNYFGNAANPTYCTVVNIGNTNVSNIFIENNYFGGRSPQCGGSAYVFANPNGNRNRIRWITSTGTNITINNNVFANIQVESYTTVAQSTSEESFRSILISSGSATITNNTIGSTSSTSSISIIKRANNSTTSSVPVYGIEFSGTSGSISGNTIAGIQFSFPVSSTMGFNFAGIRMFSNGNNVNVQNNSIGSTQTNSIMANDANSINILSGMNIETSQAPIIQNNTIQNLTNLSNSTTITSNLFGINVTNGSPIIRSNTISNLSSQATTANSVVIGMNLTGGTPSFGMAGQENTISGLSNTSSGLAASVIGINNSINSFTISNNIIENITSGNALIVGITNSANNSSITNNIVRNLSSTSSSSTSNLTGIGHGTNGNGSVNNNQIYNLQSNGTAPANTDLIVVGGIIINSSNGNVQINDNQVYSIRSNATGTTDGTNVAAIMVTDQVNISMNRNRIYDITNTSEGTTPIAAGILMRDYGGNTVLANNMISLGLNTNGTSNTNDMMLVGIWSAVEDNGQTLQVFHNSVYIGGTASSGTYKTYGFLRGDNVGGDVSGQVRIVNNIFHNARAGAGSHFAIGNQQTAQRWQGTINSACTPTLTTQFVDYNALYSANPNTIGEWLGTAYNFANWQSNSIGDISSVNLTSAISGFVSPQTADLHVGNNDIGINAKGIFITPTAGFVTTITTDFDNSTRRGPDIGADEFTNTITSIADGDWNNSAIWSPAAVPTHADIVIINNNVFLATGQTGYFYGMQINNGGTLSLQGTAALYSSWYDGYFINNGSFEMSASANFYLASDFTDNGSYDGLEGTTTLNQDNIPLATCVATAYLLDFNDNTNTSNITSTVNTDFYNLTIGNLTINGSVTINSTGQDIAVNNVFNNIGSGQIVIATNTLTLNGTVTGTGTITGSTTSNLVVGGTSGSSLGTLNFTAGSQLLNDFTMQRTGAGAEVTLGTPVLYDNTLTLNGGLIQTTTTNLLTADVNATVSGGSNTSYVDGPMAKNTNSTTPFTFPVGKNNHLGQMTITPTSSLASTFNAEYFQGNAWFLTNPVDANWEASLDHVSALEYWSLTRPSGSAPASVTLHWTQYSDVADQSSEWVGLRVARLSNDGTIWENEGSGVVNGISTAQGTVRSNIGLTEFGTFTLATTIQNPGNPLPARVANLTAEVMNNQKVMLKWQTILEINNQVFEIERSTNGTDFELIGQKDGAGNSNQIRNYTFLDNTPPSGLVYYRLQQVDFAGNKMITNMVKVRINDPNTKDFNLYPSPAKEILNLDLPLAKAQNIRLVFRNMQGESVKTQVLNVSSGFSQHVIQLTDLPVGTYIVEIHTQTKIYREKIVKF